MNHNFDINGFYNTSIDLVYTRTYKHLATASFNGYDVDNNIV